MRMTDHALRTKKTRLITATPQNATAAYLFVHFTGEEDEATDEQLYFSISRDGTHWKDLRRQGDPVLIWNGGEGGVRDPFITRGPDGVFHILATDLSIYNRGGWDDQASMNGSTGLVLWESDDLVHWGEPRLVDVASSIPGAGMAWAPEASWDESRQQWIVYWSTRAGAGDPDNPLSNELGDPINVYYAISKDLRTFSQPVKWIDRSSCIIDTTMIRTNEGWWIRASKDDGITLERTKNPYAATYEVTRTDDDQAWSYVSTLTDIFGQGRYSSHYLEGPELFFYNTADAIGPDGRCLPFGLMCDQFAEAKGYISFRSADLSSADKDNWAQADYIDFGKMKKRHGSILPLTEEEYASLEQTLAGIEHGERGLW